MASCPSESDGGSSESNAKTKISTKNQQSQNEPIEKQEWAGNYGEKTKNEIYKFWPQDETKGRGDRVKLHRCPRGSNDKKRGGEGVTLSAVSTGHSGTILHSAISKNGSF